MTALSEYQRLECPGLWRESPQAQRRDVIVTFGDATIILRESPSERALTHWSLPAVIRLNPGKMPALFGPGSGEGEELEIDDETMIAAITKVHAIIAARRPHPGRLRGVLLLTAAGVMLAGALLWLPGALIAHTARVLPATTRSEVGQAILGDLQRLTGSPCAAPDGAAVLQTFSDRLIGGTGHIVVLPEGLKGALHVPGNTIAIGRALIENHDTPEVSAGFVLAERQRAALTDPLPPALRYAGFRAVFHILTTGEVPADAFRGYGETLLKADPTPLDPGALLKRFADAGVGSSAYAYTLDPSGETTLPLIEADPFGDAPPPQPLLTDTDWVALQGICAS
ncbi:MAG TPA: hypothetical protein PK450_10470 [Paracoccaceae bacterium]|nr:hypothetical protein [Paracoccaceae bacterium]